MPILLPQREKEINISYDNRYLSRKDWHTV